MTPPVPFVLATGNADKAREIIEVLVDRTGAPLVAFAADNGFVVDTPDGIARTVERLGPLPSVPEVDETGDTLEENARLKAVAFARAFGLVAVADDTGLEVAALGGAPGVRSARYAGERATYQENVAKLLAEMRGVEHRAARFATVAIARWPDGREISVRGEVAGTITTEPRGMGGFGYDPVFVPVEGDGRTFAEMAPDEKHSLSHRGRAFRALAAALDERG
jgi:XTP/dITP diphosphohydrolase